MRPVLLFDLDGTLVDSAEGVYLSLNSALTSVGLPAIRREDAKKYLGPPLEYSLRHYHNLHDDRLLQQVWDAYAEHYRTQGHLRTYPVPGIPELCAKLKSLGYRLAVATCKPWAYCDPILESCKLSKCFEVVAGSLHNGIPEEKSAVIQEALRLLSVQPDEALMIGDRAYDVVGARAFGIPCVGVEFCGYADARELEDAGAVAIVATPKELEKYILSLT